MIASTWSLSQPLATLSTHGRVHAPAYTAGRAHVDGIKSAGGPVTAHALAGRLYLSKSGWILLEVPNSLVRGAFDALNEPGAELPFQSNGTLNAHITVMRPEEIEQIGGPDKITERGHSFSYTLGPVQEVVPDGWQEMAKVWYIQVKSPDLQNLRKTYGLSPKPNDSKYDFHITIGVRRKGVMQNNSVSKAAGDKEAILGPIALAATIGMAAKQTPEEQRADDAEVLVNLAEQDALLNQIRQQHADTTRALTRKPRRRKRIPLPAPLMNVVPVKLARDLMPAGLADDIADEEPNEAGPQQGEEVELEYTNLPNAAGDINSNHLAEDPQYFTPEEIEEKNASAIDLISSYYGHDKAGVIRSLQSAAEDPLEQKERKRKELIRNLGIPGLAAAGGLAGLMAVNRATETRVPYQITRFMGIDRPQLVRGRVGPGAPASTLDETGLGYLSVVAPGQVGHIQATGISDLIEGAKAKLGPEQKLGLLELISHSTPYWHAIGTGTEPGLGTVSISKAPGVAARLEELPWALPAEVSGVPRIIAGGCHGGVCLPEVRISDRNYKPSWQQQLANRLGIPVTGSRSYLTYDPELTSAMPSSMIPSESGGVQHGPIAADPGRHTGTQLGTTTYQPNLPPFVTDETVAKKTTWPSHVLLTPAAGRIRELLYNIGKPLATAGALASPFLENERTARNIAVLSTIAALPMLVQESAARLAQSKLAPDASASDILKDQANVLPYLGLTALPLLTYGGAKLMGRWDKDEKEAPAEQRNGEVLKRLAEYLSTGAGLGAGAIAGHQLGGGLGAGVGGGLGAILGNVLARKLTNRRAV